jgi:hypothetical protein
LRRKIQSSRHRLVGARLKKVWQCRLHGLWRKHFYGLTGTRPTRITPTGGGKAHGPFLEFLATTYTILGIKASAENQAKAAINFVMKKYPKT